MRRISTSCVLYLATVLPSGLAQTTEPAADDPAPASSNLPGAEYPKIHPDLRVSFRLKAPDAQKFRLHWAAPRFLVHSKWKSSSTDASIFDSATDPILHPTPGFVPSFPGFFRLNGRLSPDSIQGRWTRLRFTDQPSRPGITWTRR